MKCAACFNAGKYRGLWEHNPEESKEAFNRISHLISAWVGLGQVHRARWKGRWLCRISSIYRGSEARESEAFVVLVKEEGGKMSVDM